MEEQYYLIPKERMEIIIHQLYMISDENNCVSTTKKANELKTFPLIDLSDSAIEEEAKEYSKEFDLSFYDTVDEIPVKELAKKDYSEALKTLKNKLKCKK